jgi:hypothetical protein
MKPSKQKEIPAYKPARVDSQNYRPIETILQAEPKHIVWLRLLWEERAFLMRVTVRGLILATLVAFLLPVRYEAKTRLMPPDDQSGSGLAMLAAFAGRGSSSGRCASSSSAVAWAAWRAISWA